MSILKFVNATARGEKSLKKAIDYIFDQEKTDYSLMGLSGVRAYHEADDMLLVQKLHGKDKGRRYIHYVLSFGEGVDEKEAYRIISECASQLADGFQYVYSVHTNTENVHSHVIVNSVNALTGKKFSQSRKQMLDFRDRVNGILKWNGLAPIGDIVLVENWKRAQEYGYSEDDDEWLEEDYPDECFGDDDCGYEHCQYGISEGCFGPVEREELELIAEAEKQSAVNRQIINYFEGKTNQLPEGVDYIDAELYYQQWQEFLEGDDEYDKL